MDRLETLLRTSTTTRARPSCTAKGRSSSSPGRGRARRGCSPIASRRCWRRGLAQPHEVLAVTFTNKAAREMAERVEPLVGGSLRGGFVGTFHRFALQLLRNHPREAGLPRALRHRRRGRAAPAPRAACSRRSACLRAPARAAGARSRISAAKNALLGPEAAGASARRRRPSDRRGVRGLPGPSCTAAGAVDFDDMLLLSARLLERHEALRKGLAEPLPLDPRGRVPGHQQRPGPPRCGCSAGRRPTSRRSGDEDQSIYRWRGAEIENILGFEATYPNAARGDARAQLPLRRSRSCAPRPR